jgi:hypothetical protein
VMRCLAADPEEWFSGIVSATATRPACRRKQGGNHDPHRGVPHEGTYQSAKANSRMGSDFVP